MDAFYEATFHRLDWTLADAFRPQPGWGTKTSRVPVVARQPGWTDEDLIAGARAAAATGYRLTRLALHDGAGGSRLLWSTVPDARFADTQPQDAPAG